MLRYPYELCSFYLPQTPTPEQEGPSTSNLTFLESVGSKELAYYITQYDYELFNAVNIVSISSFVWQVEIAELVAFKHCGLTPISVTISLNFLICKNPFDFICSMNIYSASLAKRATNRSQQILICFSEDSMRWQIFLTLFARYYECIFSLDCILIGLKVNSSLSVIMISSFRSSFGSKHRFFSLNISTSGFISWKSSSSWPHSKWFLKEIFNWMSKVI